MSLKENIIEYLKRNKRIDLDQLYSLCGRERKKVSNAERRLRELMSPKSKDYNPNIKAEKNLKGAIVAYVWQDVKGDWVPFDSRELFKSLGSSKAPSDTCSQDHHCWHRRRFNYCRCPVEVKQVNSLF